jgi:hypothetical protein
MAHARVAPPSKLRHCYIQGRVKGRRSITSGTKIVGLKITKSLLATKYYKNYFRINNLFWTLDILHFIKYVLNVLITL